MGGAGVYGALAAVQQTPDDEIERSMGRVVPSHMFAGVFMNGRAFECSGPSQRAMGLYALAQASSGPCQRTAFPPWMETSLVKIYFVVYNTCQNQTIYTTRKGSD
jgi:hypothetical protein